MTIVWPITLPGFFEVSGFEQTAPNTAVSTAMECGQAKRRQRYTAAVRPNKGTMKMTAAQQATLDNFYTATLGGGTLPFQWIDPISGATRNFSFTAPPKYTGDGAANYQATLELELLP